MVLNVFVLETSLNKSNIDLFITENDFLVFACVFDNVVVFLTSRRSFFLNACFILKPICKIQTISVGGLSEHFLYLVKEFHFGCVSGFVCFNNVSVSSFACGRSVFLGIELIGLSETQCVLSLAKLFFGKVDLMFV